MNPKLLLHTIVHLRPKQVFYQLWYRLHKPKYKTIEAPNGVITKSQTEPLPKYHCLDGEMFTFLNLEHKFSGWNFTDNGMLWAYNQNYFDWLNQEEMTTEEGRKWIDKFIKELPSNKVGLDPYPIALRSINWIKFFSKYPECATKERLNSLYSQVKMLEKKLEYHLLGNHLLEDAYALYISGAFFQDIKIQNKATKLLLAQLKEQTLADGAHYEQSPMYHCILLDRLLDCINIAPTEELKAYAQKQLGWLKSICYNDGSYPLFNDAASCIAPKPSEIINYANRLEIESEESPLGESGYRKLSNTTMEAIVDVGDIKATYQPGHTHADTFSYELRIEDKPFVVDTGISTYNKNERRQYERSTSAHNTVVVNGQNSSEVWGGFRVGKRAKVKLVKDNSTEIFASHNGFSKPCHRTFKITDEAFIVEDHYDGDAVSFIHLAGDADLKRIKIDGASKIDIEDGLYSIEYNKFITGKVMKMHFNGELKYKIK